MDSVAVHSRTARTGLWLLAFALVLPTAADASGARTGVKAQPGEMVLLRDVSARTAYRPAPPGIALIADPTPNQEISGALGTSNGMDELGDDDFASMGSNTGVGSAGHQQTTVERVTGGTINATLGKATQNGVLSGSGLTQSMSTPLNAVGNATRGIGDTVRGALSQFPMGGQPAGGPGK